MVAAAPCCDCYWTILWFFVLVHQWFSLYCSLVGASWTSQQQAETCLHNPINIHGQAGPLTVLQLFQTQFTKVKVSGCWVPFIYSLTFMPLPVLRAFLLINKYQTTLQRWGATQMVLHGLYLSSWKDYFSQWWPSNVPVNISETSYMKR